MVGIEWNRDSCFSQLRVVYRKRLKREGKAPLAAGNDRLELKSRVQLMDGPLYAGHYMIGCVNFVRAPDSMDAAESEDSTLIIVLQSRAYLPPVCAFQCYGVRVHFLKSFALLAHSCLQSPQCNSKSLFSDAVVDGAPEFSDSKQQDRLCLSRRFLEF